MKLLEVVRGAKTAKDVLATVMALAKKIRKTAVVSGVCDGFIGNRMIEQYTRQAGFLLDEGCTPAQVDKAIEKFGFAMGPFRMGDLAGNDIGWAIRKRRYVEKPDLRYSKTADLLCEMGRFGQKTSAGWYDYDAGKRDAIPSPVVVEMIEKHRAALGITPRKISDDEIVQRLVYALVNEGARILEEGIASKASDIDMVYLTGYGFPLHRGGPMCYADTVGLFNVVQAMKRFAANPLDDAAFWQPAPLLAKLAAEGKTLQLSPDLIEGTHHDPSRHRLHRPHAAGQELEGRLQHDPRRHARRPCGQGRRRARRHRPGRGRRRADGLRQPRGRHRHEHRAPDRAARRAAGHAERHHRQPLLLQRPADHRDGGAAHHRRRGRRASWPAAWRASPACSRR